MQLHFAIQGLFLGLVGIGVLIMLVIVLVIWHFVERGVINMSEKNLKRNNILF